MPNKKKIIPGRGSAKKAIEANLAKQKAKKLAEARAKK